MSNSVTPWTVALQAPLCMEFSRQEYWSGLPFPTPGASSLPRDWNPISCISCIDRWILYHCTTWEVQQIQYRLKKREQFTMKLRKLKKKWGMKKLGWKSSRDCSKILRKPWQSWLGAPKQGSPVRRVLHCGQSQSCAVWSKSVPAVSAVADPQPWWLDADSHHALCSRLFGKLCEGHPSIVVTYVWLQSLCLVLKAKVILENAMGR